MGRRAGPMSITEADAGEEQAVAMRIAAAIYDGDRSAEALLYSRYQRGLHYVIQRRTRDRDFAEDIVQETFRVALEHLRRQPLEDPGRLAGYLRGIAVNLLIAEQRKDIRRATDVDSDAVSDAADDGVAQSDVLAAAEIAHLVRKLLNELKVERDRELLFRVYVYQEDKERICRELGLDALHFNRVLHRAKQRFRELLSEAERRNHLRLVE
jgi:RNA polymerase sigma-70 factor, ECF subfamily